MKLNRKWMLLVALVLSVAMATTGTLAYLTDTDADVNVMTLGKVEIVQNEQERDEDGELQPFTPNKPALPAVYKEIQWDDERVTVGDTGYLVFADDMKNVVDKIVTVTNTGKNDAYIRTIIAIEEPAGMYEHAIHINVNDDDSIRTMGWENVEINGVRYAIAAFTYNEKLPAGETSAPSLMQVFLDKQVDNEDVEKLGDTWEILVLSQAVQADGFEEWGAEEALNEAFNNGEKLTATKAAEWFDGWNNWEENGEVGSPGDKNETNNPPEKELPTTKWSDNADTSWFDASKTEFTIDTAAELAGLASLERGALAGKTVKLGADVDLGEHLWAPINVWCPENKFVFDGQNHTVSNMTIATGADVGLFGSTTATIKNVVIDKANITSSGRSAFVSAQNYGDIINCHVTNSIIEDNYWAVGGIAGLYNAGNISDCSLTNVRITSNGGTGGIVGVINETSGVRKVENCHVYNSVINNTGVYGEAYSGAGIVGMINISNSTVNISNCTVDAKLKGEYIYEIYAPADEDVTVVVE